MSRIENGDIVKYFKREGLTEEQLKENPLMYLYRVICMDAKHWWSDWLRDPVDDRRRVYTERRLDFSTQCVDRDYAASTGSQSSPHR